MMHLYSPKEPYWLDVIPGVRTRVRPANSVIMAAARATMSRQIAEMVRDRDMRKEVGASIDDLPDLDDPDMRAGLGDVLFKKALARHAILVWEGVLKAESKELAPVNAETIGDFMMVPRLCDGFYYKYLEPLVMLDAEKNASSPAPSGTGDQAGDQPIAPDAAATDSPAPQGDAARAATSAPTLNFSPRP